MKFELTEDTLLLYAAKNYMNPQFSDIEDFNEDLKRFKYIKRLLNRYIENNDLAERLILNHLICVSNVFGIEACNRMMWFKIDENHYQYIKPFLVYLHYLPEDEKVEVIMDPNIVEVLRKL